MARIMLAFAAAATLLVGASVGNPETSAALAFRNPVVLSVAPDAVDCAHPDDPDGVEDVQIAGLCFLGDIASAFLSASPDGSGDSIPLSKVVNVGRNIVTATVPLARLSGQPGPFYVFVVRGTDGKRSTSFPNAFGYDVTFSCVASTTTPVDFPTMISCKVARTGGGRFVIQVTGAGFIPNDTIVLIDGTPCRHTKYPSRFIDPTSNTTTRIDCVGGIKRLLPAVVTVRTGSTGQTSENSINCGN